VTEESANQGTEPSSTPPPAPDPDQGTEWVDFIGKELDREYSRRDVINTRAAGTITGTTALVTVSLAVVAVIKGEHYPVGSALQVGLLVGALLGLLIAAVLSILTGALSGRYRLAAVEDMNRMLSAELWASNEIDARNYTGQLNVLAIRTLRAGNTLKYRFLVLALACQAVGIFFLGGFAVAVIAAG
jgi:hypothetical protein